MSVLSIHCVESKIPIEILAHCLLPNNY